MSESEKNIERLVQEAVQAGVPRDQLERFLQCGYIPFPWQLRFHAAAREADKENGPVDLGAGGARGPGKSHALLAQVAIDDCQRVDGLKGLFLRKTGKAAKESFEDLIAKVLGNRVPHELSSGVLRFKNGSRIILGGYKDENDIDKYIGIEYDVIVVEEENQLTASKILAIKGSLRTSKTNWRPRFYGSFNPGGIGHANVKETYVVPFRENRENKTRFFPANYKDNPKLNKEYVEYLEDLPGELGKAWREGDFDLFEGQYFKEWRYNLHVIEPHTIFPYFRKFLCMDYGYAKPSAVYWCYKNSEGQVIVYRELYTVNCTYEKLTHEIISLTAPNEELDYWVADPAIWSKKGENAEELSGAEIIEQTYREVKDKLPLLIKGDNNRVIGWNVLREHLKPVMIQGKQTAKLLVFSTCTNLIRTLPGLVYDDIKVEDLNTEGEDHAADAIRYGLMSRPPESPTFTKTPGKIYIQPGNEQRRTTTFR